MSRWKGVIRFWKKSKLGPIFVGHFGAIARVRKVTYRLDLPIEPNQIHNTFRVSQLRKCLANDSKVLPFDGIKVDERLIL